MSASGNSYEAFLEQWRLLSRRIQSQLGPTLELQRQLNETVQRAMPALIENQQRMQRVLNQAALKMPDLSPVVAQLANVQNSLAPAFEKLRESLRELPPHAKEAVLVLANHGWYFDLNMEFSELWELRRSLLEGDVEAGEARLCDYFEARLDDIEASIAASFPARAGVIGAAFSAHRRGEYTLSIPVLLAQADGICKDATDKYYFLKDGKRPQTARFVEELTVGSLREALLAPLAQTLPIGMSERERGEGFDALNRHQVMHGESLDYGTRLNGLKAVSLLNYVAVVLHDESSDA